MIKRLFLLLCLSITAISYSQTNFELDLDSIQSEQDAEKMIDRYKSNKGKIVIFNTEKHLTRLANELYDLSVGGKKVYETDINKTFYKVLDKQSIQHYRMSYILLDNSELSFEKSEALKFKIMSKFRRGQRFEDLASRYSIDNSAYTGGDSGWVTKGSFFDEVENEIFNSYGVKDEFVAIDIPSKKLTFLILKTHSPKQIEELKVLKMVEEIN
ncbi:PPIC-type PPIASE domain-containing protein [Flavobacteriaceae bacterium MAR_2010_188]|nr:PPIC-type PPIASE domain-containing protein [Flavobacteriaceae bacterium MAR_2010_188]